MYLAYDADYIIIIIPNIEKEIQDSPFGRLLALAGFISKNSSHDEVCLESLGDDWEFDCTLGYVSGWGMGMGSS